MSRFPTCAGTTKDGLPCVVAKGHRGPCRKAVNRVGRTMSDDEKARVSSLFRTRPAPTFLTVYDPNYRGTPEIRRKYRGFLSVGAR